MAEQTSTPKAPRKNTATASDIDVGSGNGRNSTASQSTIDKIKDQAASFASEAGDAARKAATTGKDKAVEALGGVTRMADDAAKAVEDQFGPTYGEYARKASSGVSNFANALQSKDIDDLIEDTKAFVRKSPVVAIGAAAAVGFLLTRLVKVGSGTDRA